MAKLSQKAGSRTTPAKASNNDSNAGNTIDGVKVESSAQKPLGRNNFIYMSIAGAMIVIGFLLMLGSPSTADEFNPDIFSARRIVVGPALAFLGFVGMAVAIVIKPKHTKL